MNEDAAEIRTHLGSNPSVGDPDRRSTRMETIVSNVLQYGVLLSFAIITAGSIFLLIRGGTGAQLRPAGVPQSQSVGAVVSGLRTGDPAAIIDVGLLLLI